jgi:hypothetical protein
MPLVTEIVSPPSGYPTTVTESYILFKNQGQEKNINLKPAAFFRDTSSSSQYQLVSNVYFSSSSLSFVFCSWIINLVFNLLVIGHHGTLLNVQVLVPSVN